MAKVKPAYIREGQELMGVSEQFIRVGLQKGYLPFGKAIAISGGKYTYYISPKKFEEFTGIETGGC